MDKMGDEILMTEWKKCPYCNAEISAIALGFHINYKHKGEKNEN